MKKIFSFGEVVDGYDIKVLNEREVRAGAGILLLFAMVTFLTAWLTGNFYPTKIFVIAFLIDFFIRIFINPRYSPSLILGRFAVINQTPEYVGAPQKRFAWGIGLALSVLMFFLIIVGSVIGPINLFICLLCLTLLFFETAFGICLGCKVYNMFNKDKAQLCPGGVCEVKKKEDIQKINKYQAFVLMVFFIFMLFVPMLVANISKLTDSKSGGVVNTDCDVPDWVEKLGHVEQYKLHHGCK